MPSESIAGFLDRAQASNVLFPEQVEQLIREPDLPHADLGALCAYLQGRGVLTQYQADAIRAGRGHELSFAKYPVIDALGPCPGGTAFRVLHPALRTPLVLRKLDPVAFAPADTADAVIDRARTFGMLAHTNILHVLDAGVFEGQHYVVLDQPTDAADLGALLKEVGGAMPAFLAAEYGWSLASVLRAIHERDGWHGEVRPGLLFVGPVATKENSDGTLRRRPAPNATVKLAEVGLIPKRPPVVPVAEPVGPEETPAAPPAVIPPPEVLAYLPPERIDTGRYNAAGDIYGLGASLYLLLTGRAPFASDSHESLLNKIRSADPVGLTTLRPDVPAGLSAVVMKMLAKQPEDRPQSAAEVCDALAPFCRPGVLPSAPRPVTGGNPNAVAVAVPAAAPMVEDAHAESVEEEAWGVSFSTLAAAQAASAADTTPRKRRGEMTEADKRRSKMWIVVGLCLHLSAMGLLAAYLMGAFDSSPAPNPEPDKEQKEKKTTPKRDKKKTEPS